MYTSKLSQMKIVFEHALTYSYSSDGWIGML